MIPLTFLCDEYIYRPKLTDKKNPFEYIVPPPPTGGVGTKTNVYLVIKNLMAVMSDIETISDRLKYYCMMGPNYLNIKTSANKFTHQELFN